MPFLVVCRAQRVICSRAYHALFMRNMLIRPSREQLAEFGQPDLHVINAGEFPANRLVVSALCVHDGCSKRHLSHTEGMTSKASVALHIPRMELCILGTQYAGEMKKGVFT